ncbi:PAS domain S-box protein [Mucilaginibacter rubeus]|nr:PAS domain-containing sensor histidine kinase [Mucilaginibacter gossypii]QEM08165.1 PAS domain S-box protein [Mucilaginibacter rubeus]QEM15191.1 PAS domain S-box protein [Mucilaginibacter gossypii]
MNGQETISPAIKAGFKAMFQYVTMGVLVISGDGRIALANPWAKKLFGYQKEALNGQLVEMLIPDGFGKNHVKHREGYFKRRRARSMGYGLSMSGRRKDGKELPLEISLGHYLPGEGQLALIFITDITERTRSSEEFDAKVRERTLELTQSLAREKGLNEMKSRFVAMASHEFRTPLSAILSSLSLAESYRKIDEEEKRYRHIQRIRASVKNLTGILDEFLSLDKVEQGKVELLKEDFDLCAFAEDMIEEVNGMLKAGQHIDFDYKGQRGIFQDKKILRNIFLNLLTNAIKYSAEKQAVHLDINAGKKRAVIEVRDEGIGIPADEQKKIFTKFYRARNATNIQGTGLGLNIVKRYVDLLDGSINFLSLAGQGTTFTIELPLDQGL